MHLYEGQCPFAGTLVPRITLISRSLLWAVPAQTREAVCPPIAPVFVGVWEPKVSQPLYRQSPPTPQRCQTTSRATLHSLRLFRALGHWETLSRASAQATTRKETTSPASTPRLRYSQQPRPSKRLTLPPHQENHRHHPPYGGEKGINIYNRGSAAYAAPLRLYGYHMSLVIWCSTRSTLLRKFIITN